jgi:hypothetical protein
MRSIVYREVSSGRRIGGGMRSTTRRHAGGSSVGSLLAKLGVASQRLQRSRPRRRASVAVS